MKKKAYTAILIIATSLTCSGCYLFTPMARIPKPAGFDHFWKKEDGQILPLTLNPKNIYGMGLTYATHLRETGAEFDPDRPPPVFKKALISLNQSESPVRVPTKRELIDALEYIEPGISEKIEKNFKGLSPLLDYEGELAFVLLEDIGWQHIGDLGYAPKIGYFIANDLSARTIAILGEGKSNRYEYWGASKSFEGFLPAGRRMWVPDEQKPDSILHTTIVTTVNGEVRQKQSTGDMMYTPRQMLMFIAQKYPDDPPQKGDVVLTGTPGGVAIQVPAWKAWLANVLDIDRFVKLLFAFKAGERNKKFLKPGDEVVVSGGTLGNIKTCIVRSDEEGRL